jgi:hypothetical protein
MNVDERAIDFFLEEAREQRYAELRRHRCRRPRRLADSHCYRLMMIQRFLSLSTESQWPVTERYAQIRLSLSQFHSQRMATMSFLQTVSATSEFQMIRPTYVDYFAIGNH